MKLTVSQIAARCGVSERTAQRWIDGEIKKVRLQAEQVSPGYYEVDELDLRRLARRDFSTSGQAALERIEDSIGQLTERVERLEAAIDGLKHTLLDRAPGRAPMRLVSPAPAREVASGEEMSEAGYIILGDLAQEVGISRTTLYGHVTSGKYQAVARIKNPARPKEKEWWFGPEVAAQVRADYRRE